MIDKGEEGIGKLTPHGMAAHSAPLSEPDRPGIFAYLLAQLPEPPGISIRHRNAGFGFTIPLTKRRDRAPYRSLQCLYQNGIHIRLKNIIHFDQLLKSDK